MPVTVTTHEPTQEVSMTVKVRQRKGKWWVFIDHYGKEN